MKKTFFFGLLCFLLVFVSGCTSQTGKLSEAAPIQVSQVNQLFAKSGQIGVADGNGILNFFDANALGSGNLDGGFANSVYLASQHTDGGDANGN